jgi:hypothetical protein
MTTIMGSRQMMSMMNYPDVANMNGKNWKTKLLENEIDVDGPVKYREGSWPDCYSSPIKKSLKTIDILLFSGFLNLLKEESQLFHQEA